MSSVTCPATMSAAVTTAGPAAVGPQRSNLITLSTRLYGLRMNPRSVPCGQNHTTRRSEAKPLWLMAAEVGGERPPVEPPRRAGQREKGDAAPYFWGQLGNDRWRDDRTLAIAGEQDRAGRHCEPTGARQVRLPCLGVEPGVVIGFIADMACEQADPVDEFGHGSFG